MSNIANTPKIQNLIISIIGDTQDTSLLPLFKLINDYGGNVNNTKISQFGNKFVGYVVIEGRWDAITKIEQAVSSQLEFKLKAKLQTQRNTLINHPGGVPSEHVQDTNRNLTEESSEEITYLPYNISVNNLDEPGLVQKIIEFFVLQEITIQDLNAMTYVTEFGSELAQIDIKIKIPSDIHIPSLREQFDVLCYNENLDASLTPHKTI